MNWGTKLSLGLLLCSFSVYAQTPEELLSSMASKYPNESIVTLLESKKYRIEMKNNKPKVSVEDYSEKILMTDLMSSYTEGEVSYSKLRQLVDVEAWSMTPVNGSYKKFKVSDYKTKKELGSQIFHDDIESKQFVFPNLKKGSKRCQRENYDFLLPEMFDYAMILSNSPILKYEIEIVVDNDINLLYIPYNFENLKFNFEKIVEKKTTTYKWSFDDVKKYKQESMSTPLFYFAPHIRYMIADYVDKSGATIPVLKNTKDLFKFNHGFIADLKPISNPNFQKTIDSIIQNDNDEWSKARKIYYWVKKNIKYIAFEAGFQGYIPRDADDVFDKKYGDCKDMANILHKSFQYAKIDSIYLTWVGTDDIPYKVDSIHHPAAFNHMISIWKHNGKSYVLDATDPYTPLGKPSGFVQGKEGFLTISNSEYEVLPISVEDYSANRKTKTATVELVGDSLVGTAECIVTGYQKMYYLMRMDGLSEKDKFQLVKNYLELGNNKFNLKEYKEYNKDILDSPLVIKYKFTLPGYVTRLKDEIYINLYLEKYGQIDDLTDKRVAGFHIDHKSLDDVNITFKIPDGYQTNFIPKNETIEFPEYAFTSVFVNNENSINLQYEYVFDFLTLPKENYKTLKEFQNKLLDAISETISLKKTP